MRALGGRLLLDGEDMASRAFVPENRHPSFAILDHKPHFFPPPRPFSDDQLWLYATVRANGGSWMDMRAASMTGIRIASESS